MSRLPCDTPIQASAEQGEVILDGPEGLAASLTPEAAKKSAAEIARAADAARDQASDE